MRGFVAILTVVAGCSSSPEPLCEPTGGGPHWLVEGESVSFALACATGEPLAGADFAIAPLPTGATYDPATAMVTFAPGLDQAAVYQLTISVVATGETGAVKIGVADAYDDPQNVPVVDPLAYPEELGLPVFFLSPAPPDPDLYTPTTIVHGGRTYTAQAKKRGAASLGYPKNSYTLNFDADELFQEPSRGVTDRNKLVLVSTFDDNSYVRQRLAKDLWNLMDPGHVQLNTYSAVVYLDGEYWGLYTVSDHVDRHLLSAQGLSVDGNLYMAVDHDANFDTFSIQNGGSPKGTMHDGYEKKEGLPVDDFSDMDDLVTFVATSGDAEFRAGISGRVDLRDYQDWWIYVTFMLADDSAGKNSYHFHDPADPLGGPWRYIPWDFNHSFGQTWQTEREAYDIPEEYLGVNRLFERLLADPTFADPMHVRYDEILHGPFDQQVILDLIDAYIAEIDASARRDQRKWSAEYRSYGGWSWRSDFTTYDQELIYLRAWIAARWAFQDAAY